MLDGTVLVAAMAAGFGVWAVGFVCGVTVAYIQRMRYAA